VVVWAKWKRLCRPGAKPNGAHKLENVDAIERPSVTLRDKLQFTLSLGQGDVEDALTLANALKQILQRD
jgi:hypothetical protein